MNCTWNFRHTMYSGDRAYKVVGGEIFCSKKCYEERFKGQEVEGEGFVITMEIIENRPEPELEFLKRFIAELRKMGKVTLSEYFDNCLSGGWNFREDFKKLLEQCKITLVKNYVRR